MLTCTSSTLTLFKTRLLKRVLDINTKLVCMDVMYAYIRNNVCVSVCHIHVLLLTDTVYVGVCATV